MVGEDWESSRQQFRGAPPWVWKICRHLTLVEVRGLWSAGVRAHDDTCVLRSTPMLLWCR
jgi:hypothetical protein